MLTTVFYALFPDFTSTVTSSPVNETTGMANLILAFLCNFSPEAISSSDHVNMLHSLSEGFLCVKQQTSPSDDPKLQCLYNTASEALIALESMGNEKDKVALFQKIQKELHSVEAEKKEQFERTILALLPEDHAAEIPKRNILNICGRTTLKEIKQ